jgi:hypothetical protein
MKLIFFSLGMSKFQLKGCLMKCNENALILFPLDWTSNYTRIDLKNTFPWFMGCLMRYIIWPTYVKIHHGYKLDLWIQFRNTKKKNSNLCHGCANSRTFFTINYLCNMTLLINLLSKYSIDLKKSYPSMNILEEQIHHEDYLPRIKGLGIQHC